MEFGDGVSMCFFVPAWIPYLVIFCFFSLWVYASRSVTGLSGSQLGCLFIFFKIK